MRQKKVVVDKNCIQVDGYSILKGYWQKYVINIIQKLMYYKETDLCEVLGEAKYIQLYDLVDACVSNIARGDVDIQLPFYFESFGDIFARCYYTKEDIVWQIDNVEYLCRIDTLADSIDQYFDDLIMPYLQLTLDDEIVVESKSDILSDFVVKHLERKGFECTGGFSKAVDDILVSIVGVDEKVVEWIKNDGINMVRLVKDFCNSFAVVLSVERENGSMEKCLMEVRFPFWKKGDIIQLEVALVEGNVCLQAENTLSKTMFMKEIIL